jgi:pyrroline-5-carboxylate reductase
MRIGILGFGKMGEAIARGLLRIENPKKFNLHAATRSDTSAQEVSKRFSIPCTTDNRELAKSAEVILLCVKPHQAEKVLREISPFLTKDHLVLSICASITTEQAWDWSGKKSAVIRAMPNTPCLIGEGMTVLCAGPNVQEKDISIGQEIFKTLGQVTLVEEHLMDGVTGLSGCGPAFVYLIIEALSEAGVKVGLPRKMATLLAAQTLSGAAQMVLERGEHPAALKDEVTTPAGCTIDGLMALEEGKLRVTLIKAVLAAAKRSKSLRGE